MTDPAPTAVTNITFDLQTLRTVSRVGVAGGILGSTSINVSTLLNTYGVVQSSDDGSTWSQLFRTTGITITSVTWFDVNVRARYLRLVSTATPSAQIGVSEFQIYGI